MNEEFLIKGNLGRSFSKMVDSMFLKVDGCFVEKIKRGSDIFYKWDGRVFDTLEEAKIAIGTACAYLQHSIKNK